MEHKHHFIIPSTDDIPDGSSTVKGVCACGFEKDHAPFWIGGNLSYGVMNTYGRSGYEESQRRKLQSFGFRMT